MKNTASIITVAAACLLMTGCSGGGSDKGFPKDFSSMTDAQKTAWMMENHAPDSVAHILCDIALENYKGIKIDTLPNAVLYAYENYRGDSLVAFSTEFDSYSSSLPLESKMKIYTLAGKSDPMGLGYQLGLEYVANIRQKNMSADQVAQEIEAFRKACGEDTETYERFYKGFQVALNADSGVDLDPQIKARFL